MTTLESSGFYLHRIRMYALLICYETSRYFILPGKRIAAFFPFTLSTRSVVDGHAMHQLLISGRTRRVLCTVAIHHANHIVLKRFLAYLLHAFDCVDGLVRQLNFHVALLRYIL